MTSGMNGPENVSLATVDNTVGILNNLALFAEDLDVVEGYQAIVRLDALVHRGLIVDQCDRTVLGVSISSLDTVFSFCVSVPMATL